MNFDSVFRRIAFILASVVCITYFSPVTTMAAYDVSTSTYTFSKDNISSSSITFKYYGGGEGDFIIDHEPYIDIDGIFHNSKFEQIQYDYENGQLNFEIIFCLPFYTWNDSTNVRAKGSRCYLSMPSSAFPTLSFNNDAFSGHFTSAELCFGNQSVGLRKGSKLNGAFDTSLYYPDETISNMFYFRLKGYIYGDFSNSIDAEDVSFTVKCNPTEDITLSFTDLMLYDSLDDINIKLDETVNLNKSILYLFEDFCPEILFKIDMLLNSSGYETTEPLDDSTVVTVTEEEDAVLSQPTDPTALYVSIDSAANDFIWATVSTFATVNRKVFGMFITMLTLGIVSLILNR